MRVCRSQFRVALLMVVFGGLGSPAVGEEIYVTFTQPSPGAPIFGQVMVELEVEPVDRVQEVDLFVDGRFVARMESAPFRIPVELGQDNQEHRFEALARGEGLEPGHALLVTPALRVDGEVELRLQQLYVTVERHGRRLLDLTEEDFAVFDQGRRQELVTFERGAVPLTAILLIDASSSMRGRPLEAARRGARAFLGRLFPLDLAKIMLFSDRVLHTTPFTGFKSVLTSGLSAAEADGGTALNDHLYLALRRLDERQGRRVVVLLSDGVEVASALDVEEVRWLARRSQTLIYWLRLGHAVSSFRTVWRDEEANHRQREGLEAMVVESGGRIVEVAGIDEIGKAFEAVMRELRDQYVLGYYPDQRVGRSSWREVEVRTRQKRLDVRARKGYVDR